MGASKRFARPGLSSSFLGLLLILALGACSSGDNQDLKDWMREATKGMKGKVPPLPEVRSGPSADYEAGNLLDPFSATKIEPEKKTRGGGLQPDMNRRREPLESFPLESLKMVGTLSQKNTTYALIQADKSLYQVRVGNYMGQSFGVITRITDSEITLKELVEDATGDWTDRISTLQLQETGK
ncbi:MAG: pilus assembly protein PilP [Rhodocyclaceae bacterium]|nr:pilus assembly protein PilP [Rhodocyclaceae bacterium]